LPQKKNLWFDRLAILNEVEGKSSFPPAEPSQFRSDIFKQTPQKKLASFTRNLARRFDLVERVAHGVRIQRLKGGAI